jgi:hypothetical protein
VRRGAQRIGARVEAYEEARGFAARAGVGEPAVAGAEVDGDASRVGRDERLYLVLVDALEALPAHDDHVALPSSGSSIARDCCPSPPAPLPQVGEGSSPGRPRFVCRKTRQS